MTDPSRPDPAAANCYGLCTTRPDGLPVNSFNEGCYDSIEEAEEDAAAVAESWIGDPGYGCTHVRAWVYPEVGPAYAVGELHPIVFLHEALNAR